MNDALYASDKCISYVPKGQFCSAVSHHLLKSAARPSASQLSLKCHWLCTSVRFFSDRNTRPHHSTTFKKRWGGGCGAKAEHASQSQDAFLLVLPTVHPPPTLPPTPSTHTPSLGQCLRGPWRCAQVPAQRHLLFHSLGPEPTPKLLLTPGPM